MSRQVEASGFSTWKDSDSPPAETPVEHIYQGDQFLQNYDGTNYGEQWRWTPPQQPAHNEPLKSPNADTTGQTGYNIGAAGGAGDPQRRTMDSKVIGMTGPRDFSFRLETMLTARRKPGYLGRGYPTAGNLYAFKLPQGLCVYLAPVEACQSGPFKGFITAYVLGPKRTPSDLAAHTTKADQVIPYVMVPYQWFRDGTFVDTGVSVLQHLPLYARHIFHFPSRKVYEDLHGNSFQVEAEDCAPGLNYSPAGLCLEIGKALGLKLDCWSSFAEDSEADAKRLELPADDHENSKTLYITLRIPYEPGALRDEKVDMMGIESAIVSALGAQRAGSSEGGEHGSEAANLFLRIRPRKYPEAITAIREALQTAGVLKYQLLRERG